MVKYFRNSGNFGDRFSREGAIKFSPVLMIFRQNDVLFGFIDD